MRLTFCILNLIFVFACSDKQPDKKRVNIDDAGRVSEVAFTAPDKPAFFNQELHKIQQQIIQNPSNRELKEAYVYNAYFPENNAFISLGSARTLNPETETAITPSLVRRAALLDAKRWAVYGLLWLNNDFKPDFGKISEQYTGVFQELDAFKSGDSLIISIATPVR